MGYLMGGATCFAGRPPHITPEIKQLKKFVIFHNYLSAMHKKIKTNLRNVYYNKINENNITE